MNLIERPRVICLCGSTRFYRQFQEANYRETMAGRIVLSVGFYPHAAAEAHGQERGCTPEQKLALDELHKRKIDLAGEVLVIDCKRPRCPECLSWLDEADTECLCPVAPVMTPYIGDSTRREIAYAESIGRPVRYLSKE